MTLLEFARGPALQVAMIIFVLGATWRFFGALLLPWRLAPAEPRKGALSPIAAAFKGVVVKMWPHKPFQKAGMFTFVNGYILHFGLAIVVFLFAPHILFIKGLTGLSWPALPNNIVHPIAIVTLASLVAGLVHRLRSPVLRLISRADDYVSWLATILPVLTGLHATIHAGGSYETLLAIHILSICAFLIWFPFGKLMHAFMFVFSRAMTGVRMGQRGAEL
ncbi:MAG: hypothetical protein KDJ40_08215 [Hyphomicrobiales bacterium]|nr:hypothetical protein [Hyphomicrobiales bacterium]